jgi:hypothetical protein
MGNIFISSKINEKDFESLFGNTPFPLTKAEVIHRAKTVGVPPALLVFLNSLPSRFCRSKEELINLCICRSMRNYKVSFANSMASMEIRY